MKKIDTSVIIVNWNGRVYLKDNINSLLKQTYKNFEIILIDNGSNDDSISFVSKNFPNVRIIKNDKNLGFAKANNQGIKASTGEYIITLNNDMMVNKNFLYELVKVAKTKKEIGSVSAKILFSRLPNLINSVGISILKNGNAINMGKFRNKNNFNKDIYIFGAPAGASLYKKDMLKNVGLFDEKYFCYLEDVDLAWRAQLNGWKSLYAHSAIAFHVHSATSSKLKGFKIYYIERNRIKNLIKYFPLKYILLSPLYTLFLFFRISKIKSSKNSEIYKELNINFIETLYYILKANISNIFDIINLIKYRLYIKKNIQKISNKDVINLINNYAVKTSDLK